MAISAEQLNVILSARDKEFARAMERNQKRIERFSRTGQSQLGSTGRAFDMIGSAARRAGPLIAGAFSVQALNQAANLATELVNLSTLTGVNVEQFQEMAFASGKFGISQEKLADILKDVNDKVGDFMQTGGGPLKDFFENIAPKVGVTADAFRSLNSADALQLYVDTLQQAGVSQQEMTFYMEALASDAAMLTPLLADNGAEMGNLADRARALGIVLDEDLVRQTAQMDQVWSTVMSSMDRNFQAFAMNVINGFDNIFGITTYGQFNIAARAMRDLTMEADGLNAALTEAGVSGAFVVDEFSGVGGVGVATAEAARSRLADIENERAVVQAEMDELQILLDKLEGARADISTTRSIGAAGGGSSASETDKIREAFERLMSSLDEAAKADNAFAAAQETVNAALSAGIITSDEAALAMSLITRRMQEAKGEAIDLSSIASTLQSSMESAFMSMIDGTASAKDAFRSMATEIIKELYRVLVVQQMVGSFKTGGGGILGAIAPMFGRASGGSVMAGTPYMVGENGREPFIPAQNGRILSTAQAKDALGGGGGSTVVNQTINISTGVQQTVRAEVMTLLPKIAEASKAAVLDARKRGGSYAAAFK